MHLIDITMFYAPEGGGLRTGPNAIGAAAQQPRRIDGGIVAPPCRPARLCRLLPDGSAAALWSLVMHRDRASSRLQLKDRHVGLLQRAAQAGLDLERLHVPG